MIHTVRPWIYHIQGRSFFVFENYKKHVREVGNPIETANLCCTDSKNYIEYEMKGPDIYYAVDWF